MELLYHITSLRLEAGSVWQTREVAWNLMGLTRPMSEDETEWLQ